MMQKQKQPISLEQVLDNFLVQQQSQLNVLRLVIQKVRTQEEIIIQLQQEMEKLQAGEEE